MSTSQGAPRPGNGAVALAVASAAVLCAAQAGLWLGIEPVATWSYDLSWWSAILLADSVVHLRTGASILRTRPRGFLGLAFASAPFWLLYECANLRLANWYYVGIPADLLTRTIGVYLSFATVLPGVLEIDSLIESFGPRSVEPRTPVVLGAGLRSALLAAGLASLALPLLFPRTAYPLIWGAAFLLLEPVLAHRDGRSLLAGLVRGDRGPLARMLLAGLVAGAMWETWNWRSPAKWIYTVPLFEEGKLFEMPYLGFVGFLPFALGCHSFGRALVLARWIPEWDPALPRTETRSARVALVSLLFSALAIGAVNRFTVHATQPTLADVSGLGAGERKLMTVRGMGRRGLDWLAGAGIRSPAELAAQDPLELHGRILAARAGPDPVPSVAEVRVWVFGARAESR